MTDSIYNFEKTSGVFNTLNYSFFEDFELFFKGDDIGYKGWLVHYDGGFEDVGGGGVIDLNLWTKQNVRDMEEFIDKVTQQKTCFFLFPICGTNENSSHDNFAYDAKNNMMIVTQWDLGKIYSRCGQICTEVMLTNLKRMKTEISRYLNLNTLNSQ